MNSYVFFKYETTKMRLVKTLKKKDFQAKAVLIM